MRSLRISVPDAWRIEYPRYVADHNLLKCLYAIILLVALGVLFGYGYYLYEVDLDYESTIVYDSSKKSSKDGWKCISLIDFSETNFEFQSYFNYIHTF